MKNAINHDWSMRTRIPPMEKALNAATRPPPDMKQENSHKKAQIFFVSLVPLCGCFLPDQLAQDIVQNAAVAVILNFVWCVDSHCDLECFVLSVGAPRANRHKHAGLDTVRNPVDIKRF